MDFYGFIRYFIVCAISWTLAQLIKVLISVIKKEKADMLCSGGMPSSHTAVVMSLTLRIGLVNGFDSGVFAVSIIFAIVTMFDAVNVRLAVGLQAMRLNQLIKDVYSQNEEKCEQVKVVKGHTIKEVGAGLVLGVVVSLLYTFIENAIIK